ncbi:MAG: hypothetical protein WCK67_07005 [bacterium]
MNNIKKILASVLLSSLLLSGTGYASTGSCTPKPYPISNSFSRTLQKVTGLNFVVKNIAQSVMKREILKTVSGDVNVKLDLYSVGDANAGKFKGLKISGKNLTVQDIHVSSLEAKTLCDFIHINYKKNPVVPLSDIFVGFKSYITENDINETLNAPIYQAMFSGLKFNNILDLSILNPKVNIENNQINLSGNITFSGMPGIFSIPLNLGIQLMPDNGKIRLSSLEILSKSFIDLNFMNGYVKTFKPVIFDFKSISKNGEIYNIKSLNIKDNGINIEGTYFLPTKKSAKAKV